MLVLSIHLGSLVIYVLHLNLLAFNELAEALRL